MLFKGDTPTANPTYFVLAGRAAIELPSLPGTSAFTLIESYRSLFWPEKLMDKALIAIIKRVSSGSVSIAPTLGGRMVGPGAAP